MRKALCAVPPMGWNSWNTFTEKINEDLIKEMVDSMKEQGFLDAGYEYVVIDDCWSLKERDENGKLVADPENQEETLYFQHASGGLIRCMSGFVRQEHTYFALPLILTIPGIQSRKSLFLSWKSRPFQDLTVITIWICWLLGCMEMVGINTLLPEDVATKSTKRIFPYG